MDKILSARVDEGVVRRIGSLARRLNTSKKNVIESAVELYAQKVEGEQNTDVLEETCGAWKRKESAEQLVRKARGAFRQSMTRRRK